MFIGGLGHAYHDVHAEARGHLGVSSLLLFGQQACQPAALPLKSYSPLGVFDLTLADLELTPCSYWSKSHILFIPCLLVLETHATAWLSIFCVNKQYGPFVNLLFVL